MKRVKISLLAALAVLAFNGIGCDGNGSPVLSDTEQTQNHNQNGGEPPLLDDSSTQTHVGTKWKLVGIGSLETKIGLRELEPKDCEKCYTLIFDTDTSFSGRSQINDFGGVYKADYNDRTMQIFDYEQTIVGGIDMPDNYLFESIFSNNAITSFYRDGNKLYLYIKGNQEYDYLFFTLLES